MSEHSENAPSGTPQMLIVDGILDGRVGNPDELERAVDGLGTSGAGHFRLDVTGGRFSMLPVETHVPPAGFDAAAQSNFLDRLQAVVDAALPDSVETTLRCKLVYDDEVSETLFTVQQHRVEPLTRRRPRTEDDAPRLPPVAPEQALGISRRQILWIAPLLLVAGVALAWTSGWIDRVLAARAEAIQADTGPFGDMVTLTLERSWGNYQATIVRGPGYPQTPEALATRRDGSDDLQQRAACELVGNGGELFVQIVDEQGKVLAEDRTELRALLTADDGEATAKLPGQMSADRIVLALSSGKKSK